MVVAFDDVGAPGEPADSPMEEEKRSIRARRVSAAESFSAVQIPSDDAAVTSPNPTGPATQSQASRRPSMPTRPTSAERIATWVSRRLSGRPTDSSDFYRTSGSQNGLPRGRSPSTTSILRKDDASEYAGTESIYSMYTAEDVQRLTGVVNAPVRAPRRSEMFTPSSSAPPVPKLNLKDFDGESSLYPNSISKQ